VSNQLSTPSSDRELCFKANVDYGANPKPSATRPITAAVMVNVNEPSPIEHKIRVLEMLASPNSASASVYMANTTTNRLISSYVSTALLMITPQLAISSPDILVSLSSIVH
jgi:hypothetical protein